MKSLNSNNLGKVFLVERCRKISISDFLKDYKKMLKQSMADLKICIDGVFVEITTTKSGNGGYRYWYLCPICRRRCGMLFKHPLSDLLGCRRCFGLEYKKRRYKGMIESQI